MSKDTNWSIRSYRDPHESSEHWELRRAFMERWKSHYPEDRLVCLGRVFTNIELMGCRYPEEIMTLVKTLSEDVVQEYRRNQEKKLKRTFVSAQIVAQDRARSIKRPGIIISEPPEKIRKVQFVQQGHCNEPEICASTESPEDSTVRTESIALVSSDDEQSVVKESPDKSTQLDDYLQQMSTIKCVDCTQFRNDMFDTSFGKLVLIVRPWLSKLVNIQASCSACHVAYCAAVDRNSYGLSISGRLVAEASGSKADAKSAVELMAWKRLSSECVSLLVKEAFIAQGELISSSEVAGTQVGRSLDAGFGVPVESSVAEKMMRMMGWSGGGLGADSQGISEPIKPHLHQIHRSGLGSAASTSDMRQLCSSAMALMRKYAASDSLDVDLVFATDFSKEERAELHKVARRCGLISKSYGKDDERFLVVKKKLNPFDLVEEVVRRGGNTAKYEVFIPESLARSLPQ